MQCDTWGGILCSKNNKLTKLFLVDKNLFQFLYFHFHRRIPVHLKLKLVDTNTQLSGTAKVYNCPQLTQCFTLALPLVVILGWEMVTCWVAADYWLGAGFLWTESLSPAPLFLTMIHTNNWSLSVIQVRNYLHGSSSVAPTQRSTGSKNKCNHFKKSDLI